MTADIALCRTRLNTELSETNEAIRQSSQSAGIVELDQSGVGRVSRIDALQQQALAKGLLERLENRKRKVEAALNRMDAGTYGKCCACQSELEPERLDADPAAVFCPDCAAEREQA